MGEYVPGPGPEEPTLCSFDLDGVPIECAGDLCFATNEVVYDPGPGVTLSCIFTEALDGRPIE